MTTHTRGLPLLLAAGLVAAALTGCARGAAGDETVTRTEGVRGSAPGAGGLSTRDAGAEVDAADDSDIDGTDTNDTDTEDADRGAEADGTGRGEQTLPPGDPGAEAPGTDDPNADPVDEADEHERAPAKTTVPVTALLDTETLDAVAGAVWTSKERSAGSDACVTPVPAQAAGTRAAVFARPTAEGDGPSRLVETVATHADRAAAIAAVRAIGRRLARCAHTRPTDPRIGDASREVTLTDTDGASWRVTAVAVDGVSFVLSGTGPVTAADGWAGLADIAQGNSCEAAADGCH